MLAALLWVLGGYLLLRLVFIRRGSFEATLCRVLPYRDIAREGTLYLRRFYLSPRRWPVRVFLHHIVRPDLDPHEHDHPWPFVTVGVGSWYAEESTVPCDCSPDVHGVHHPRDIVARLDVRHRPATHRHRITHVGKGGAWTLVFAGRAEREWGFWVTQEFSSNPDEALKGTWQPWYEYLGVPNDAAPEDRIRGGAR